MNHNTAGFLMILGLTSAAIGLALVAARDPVPRRKHPLRRSPRSRPGVTIYE